MANDENKIILEFPATNVEIEFGETITFDNISGFLNSDRVTYNGESLTEEIAHLVDESEIKPLINDNAQTTSLLGSNSLTTETTTLNANEMMELGDAPRFINKNHGVTARVKFDSFTGLTIGKGYQKYRGKWIVIDATHITAHFFENSDVVQTPIAHGLTISDYLQVSMFVDADGVCRISINTTSGTFSTSVDFGYVWNYEPFLFGGQIMTDAKLSYSCDDLKCPLWVFGDSYMGFGASRVAGQLKELHFINYCINAIAGAKSVETTTPNKSSFEDLQKMLEVATPKFIIWADGMNGGDALNIEFLPTLIALCEEKGIELILYMPPSIPDVSHTELNNYIVSTGKRYVNGNDAVGATSEGVWYEGYLSSDNIHPTELGAKALALRFLNDAPELLQYGWNYDVKSDIDAKLNKANPVGTGAISFNRRGGTTVGNNSVAVGFNNTSSGDASFAEGAQSKATGNRSHAENYGTEATGAQSHAEGRNSKASGAQSHAEGESTLASGANSHSEGYTTEASGYYSHSQGYGTKASRRSQTAIGEFNIAETGAASTRGNFVEIVGNGTDDNNRSNARTLDWQGNETLAGGLTFNGSTSLESEISRLDGRIDNLPYPATQIVPASGNNLNDFHTPACFFAETGLANLPTANDNFIILNYYAKWQNASRYNLVQLAVNATNCKTYARVYTSSNNSWKSWLPLFYDATQLVADVEYNQDETDRIRQNIFGLNASKGENGFLRATGAVQANNGYVTTDYIRIYNGQSFTYRIGHGIELPVICFFTGKDKSYIVSSKTVNGIDGYVSGTFTADQDGYVRITYSKTKNQGYVVFTNDIPDNIRLSINPNTLKDKNILCLGDSIFGNDGEIVSFINDSGAIAVNGAVGGTQVSVRSGASDNFRYFDGVNLVTALCTQNWTDQETAASALSSSYPWIVGRLANLKTVDMSKVDCITMDWGTNDYTSGKTIAEITTAYNTVIDLLQQYYPSVRLLIITPIWRYFGAKADNENGDNKVYNVSTLKEIATAIDNNSKDKRIESLQMYQKMPLSYNTADLYFDSGDSTHLNTTGNKVYSQILIGKLRSMFG